MKRGAENQLSKDADDLENEDQSEPGQGFRKADESVLAGRQIRGLPKRASAANLTSAPPLSDMETSEPPPVPPVPKLASFSGFGSGSNTSSYPTWPSSASLPSFGTPISGPIDLNSNSKPAAPTVSPSASGATKAFASFLGSTHPPAPAPVPAPAPSASPVKKAEIDPAALKYYTSLRGLNVSFLSAISKAVEQDPFTDVSDMVAHYKNFRISVQKDFDERPKSAPAINAADGGSSSSSNGAQPPKPPTVPSSVFSAFGSTPAPSTLKTEMSSSSSGSSLPTTSTAPSTAPSNPPKSAFGSSATVPDSLSQPKTSSDAGTSAKPASPFGTFPSSSFGTKPATSDTTSAFSAFGNTGSKPPSSLDKDKDKDSDTKTEFISGPPSNLFGASSSSKPNPFNVSDKPPTSPFGSSGIFGTSSATSVTTAKPLPAFASFGSAKSGTFSNPVGFNFGGPLPKTSEGEAATPATTSVFGSKPSTAFGGSSFSGFGTPPAKAAAEEENGGSQGEDGDDGADDSKLLTSKTHDEEGEGEEDEETTHTTKSKVYKLVKDSEAKSSWKDMGVGLLRLKKHKETSARRVLLRNSSTGKIIINFNIYAGLNPSLGSKAVTFVGHDEHGTSVTYRLRTPTDQHATELKDAMSREIAFVKGESD